jgi:hypothetical protein
LQSLAFLDVKEILGPSLYLLQDEKVKKEIATKLNINNLILLIFVQI